MLAGFAEIDITPPIGTAKIGWIKKIVPDKIADPLFARVAVLESGNGRIAFIALDTLSIRWTQVADIRRRIEAKYAFPGAAVMVSATHNHAGPAVAMIGDVPRDEAYIETLVRKVVDAFGLALAARQEAELGFGGVFDFDVAHNRRVVMRDGTARTHGKFTDGALCLEGPIDPEVAVIAARRRNGAWLGCIVNYSCHPTHLGGGQEFSGGYPGVLAAEMEKRACPVTLFLNGPCGNTHTSDPRRGGAGMDMAQAGARLAEDAQNAMAAMTFRDSPHLAAASRTVQLPYRAITDAEVRGTARGAQRFVDPAAYDRAMPALLERIRTRKVQPAEVQVLRLDDWAVAGIPAEYFVEFGLRIKEESHPRHALVAATTNGMVGYLPTVAAFRRGGYETTFGFGYRQAPEAGDLLADAAIDLIKGV
jgi:hypothetical protein